LYVLRAAAPFGKLQVGTRVWESAAGSVRVEVGKETKDILLELTPKLTTR
jgi:hypothetical protein